MRIIKRLLIGLLTGAALSLPANARAECVEGDCLNGQGTFRFTDGAQYEGGFRQRRLHGPGTLRFANGARYEGQFEANRYDGAGTYHYNNGIRFEGQFEDGKRHGPGVLYAKDGTVLQEGLWVSNEFQQASTGARSATAETPSAHTTARTPQQARLGVSPSSQDFAAVAFSPDARWVLTGGYGGVAWLWETGTGRAVRRFEGHSDAVRAVAFSPNGRYVLTGSSDHTARIWDVATGAMVRQFKRQDRPATSVAFSPDGRLALIGFYMEAELWDVASGRPVRRLAENDDEVTHYSGVGSVAFSADGKFALTSGSLDKTARLWRVATGKELRRFEHAAELTSAAISPDGQQVLTGSEDNIARLWDVASGREIRRLEGHASAVHAVSFSSNGKLALTGSGDAWTWSDGERVRVGSDDNSARLWDVRTGSELRRFEGHSGGLKAVAFSPDDRLVVTGSEMDSTARLWDAATGREMQRLEGRSITASSVGFSPDGRRVFTGAQLWAVSEGRVVRRFATESEGVSVAALSPDGQRVLTGGWDEGARLWNVATGEMVRQLGAASQSLTAAAISPDGRLALSGSWDDPDARLWLLATGEEVRRFRGHSERVKSVAISPDGALALTGSADKTARLWDVATGQELRRLEGHTEGVSSVTFSSDGRRALTASGDMTARVWDLPRGEEVRRFVGHAPSQDPFAPDGAVAVFSPDDRWVLTGASDSTARLWDAATGREVQRLEGHSEEVSAVAFSPDGKRLLTGSYDGTTRIWRAETGEELAWLLGFDDGTWAVVDRQGRFDAPNGGQSAHLYWVVGNESIGLDQLKERYYEPGLLGKKLGLNSEALREVAAFRNVELFPEVRVVKPPSRNDPVLRLEIRNRGGGIGRVVVRVNGKEMSSDARTRGDLDAKVAALDLELDLTQYASWLKPGDENEVEVQAFNAEGYLRSRGVSVVIQPEKAAAPPPVTLWAIVAGVSSYAGGRINLRYPAKDAEDIANAVELGARALFGADRVRVKRLTSERAKDEQPTKANLRSAFEAIKQAKVGDIVFVYLSGHGLAFEDGYYYPTQDASSLKVDDPKIRAHRALSSEELARWLKESPALKQVVVLDTCAAGAAADSLMAMRSVSSDQIRALDRMKDRAGVYVLMGAAAARVSFEASQYEQGLLTHALLKGMRGARLREDQYVDIAPLLAYAAEEVPQLAKGIGGIQKPYIASPKSTKGSFDIGKLSAAARRQIPLRSPKPLVLLPTLLNLEQAHDDLRLQPKLRARLRESSYAGSAGGPATSVVFVEANEMPGAIRPSGVYRVDGSSVHVKLVLKRDDKTTSLNLECPRSALDACVEKMENAIVAQAGKIR